MNDDTHEKKPSYFEQSADTLRKQYDAKQQQKQTALQSMTQLEGWCTQFKASILMDLIYTTEAKTVVEIGVWGGKSLIPMAYALQGAGQGRIYGVDPWDHVASADGMTGANEAWWSSIDHEAIFQGLQQKISQFNLQDQIVLIRSTSENAPLIADIDILHIDGNHSEKTSYFDVLKWVPLVKQGGLIVFDDTTWGTTTRAVQWLNANCQKIGDYHEDNDWGIWLKL